MLVELVARPYCEFFNNKICLELFHSERTKLYGILAVLSAIGLNYQ